MNAIVREVFEILHRTAAMRAQLIAILSDGDLAYRLPGGNLTLGELCRDIGLVERSYIDSFITFRQSFDYPSTDPLLATSVVRLTGWYSELDATLDSTLAAISDEEIQGRTIDRGWPVSVMAQTHIYREALLIFLAKATCYLPALEKPLPQQIAEWIG
jgi:hypothetical protein